MKDSEHPQKFLGTLKNPYFWRKKLYLLKSFQTLGKVSRHSGHYGIFPDPLESFIHSWKYVDTLESFWTLWKVSKHSETFWILFKVCRHSWLFVETPDLVSGIFLPNKVCYLESCCVFCLSAEGCSFQLGWNSPSWNSDPKSSLTVCQRSSNIDIFERRKKNFKELRLNPGLGHNKKVGNS